MHLTNTTTSSHSWTDGFLPSAVQRDHRGWEEQEGQWWKLGLDGKESLSLAVGGPTGADAIRDWVGKDPIAWGLAAQPPQWHQAPSVFHMWKRRIFSIFSGDLIIFFVGGGPGNRLLRWQCGLPEDTCCRIQLISKEVTPRQRSVAVDGDPQPCGDVATAWILVHNKTLRAVLYSKFIFIHTL